MKTYSKFNDYYDYATGFYSDENKWVRKTRFENFKTNKNNSYLTKYSNKTEDLLLRITDSCRLGCIQSGLPFGTYKADDEAILVGFCGKIYPAFLFYERAGINLLTGHDEKLKGGYIDISKFMSLRNEAGKKELKTRRGDFDWWHTGGSIVDYKEFEYHTHRELDSVFVELNSPIFIIRSGSFSPLRYGYGNSGTDYKYDNGSLIVNPCLGDFGLQCSFNPFYANQEIEMYLGNQLVMRDNCDINMTDELMRHSKGFDNMSFKKRKK